MSVCIGFCFISICFIFCFIFVFIQLTWLKTCYVHPLLISDNNKNTPKNVISSVSVIPFISRVATFYSTVLCEIRRSFTSTPNDDIGNHNHECKKNDRKKRRNCDLTLFILIFIERRLHCNWRRECIIEHALCRWYSLSWDVVQCKCHTPIICLLYSNVRSWLDALRCQPCRNRTLETHTLHVFPLHWDTIFTIRGMDGERERTKHNTI